MQTLSYILLQIKKKLHYHGGGVRVQFKLFGLPYYLSGCGLLLGVVINVVTSGNLIVISCWLEKVAGSFCIKSTKCIE